MHARSFVPITIVSGVFAAVAGLETVSSTDAVAGDEPATRSPHEVLADQATRLRPFIESDIATAFLDAVPYLPRVTTPRIAYRNRDSRDAMSVAEVAVIADSTRQGYERVELDESFYYFTRYGSPLAFVRPLDLLGQYGLDTLDRARIVDFGFGSVGHLRLLAANGAIAHGIEVDPLLDVLYSDPGDTGTIPRRPGKGTGRDGEIALHFGSFPRDSALVRNVGERFDVFVSKNTLKNGYIHPAEEVDPRMLVHLGVDDRTYVRAVHRLLVTGGYFMIYNLSPPQSEERYIPWADGNSPFSYELLESIGFDVLAFDRDDTEAAREMGERLGWDKDMNLATDLFGTYTVARKR